MMGIFIPRVFQFKFPVWREWDREERYFERERGILMGVCANICIFLQEVTSKGLPGCIIDVNDIKFDEGKPYTPFEQLMFILPPQMSNLMPKQLGELMKKPDKLLVQYYPIDFKVDATVGLKYMYSEAILPEIDDEFFLEKVKKAEKKMGKEDKKRNIIKEKPFKFKKK